MAEAKTVEDIFEAPRFDNLSNAIAKDEGDRHAEVVKGMREAIKQSEDKFGMLEETMGSEPARNDNKESEPSTPKASAPLASSMVPNAERTSVPVQEKTQKVSPKTPKPSIIELANNTDFSVATIAKEANRINGKDEGEVFISLH